MFFVKCVVYEEQPRLGCSFPLIMAVDDGRCANNLPGRFNDQRVFCVCRVQRVSGLAHEMLQCLRNIQLQGIPDALCNPKKPADGVTPSESSLWKWPSHLPRLLPEY